MKEFAWTLPPSCDPERACEFEPLRSKFEFLKKRGASKDLVNTPRSQHTQGHFSPRAASRIVNLAIGNLCLMRSAIFQTSSELLDGVLSLCRSRSTSLRFHEQRSARSVVWGSLPPPSCWYLSPQCHTKPDRASIPSCRAIDSCRQPRSLQHVSLKWQHRHNATRE